MNIVEFCFLLAVVILQIFTFAYVRALIEMVEELVKFIGEEMR